MQFFSFKSEVLDPLTSSIIYRGLGALVQLMEMMIPESNLLGNQYTFLEIQNVTARIPKL